MKYKKIIFLISILICFLVIYKLFFNSKDNFRAINMVPDDAFMIVESNDPFATWKDLKNSVIWNHMQTNSFFSELNAEIYSIDSLIKENKFLFRLFGSRNLTISMHQVQNNEYGVLMIADLKSLSKLDLLKNNLTSLNNSSYSVSKRPFEAFEIFEIYDKEYKEMIYVSFHENLLVLTYDHLLLEKSLKQSSLPQLSRNVHFIEINNQIDGSGQVRILINFNSMHKLLKISAQDQNSSFNDFLSQLYFGGWKLEIKDDYFQMDGYMNGIDSVATYVNALKGTGSGSFDLPKHISKRTFTMVHLSFSSFDKLVENVEENLKSQQLYEDYSKNRKKIEKFLNITINENIISWVDNEIGILNSKSKYSNQLAEYVIVIKAKNTKTATEQLFFINEQVKKNTPVKFKSITYKNTDIHYLSATGLFKLFFGKYFNKLDKPYYMVYNNFVYFSNHPQTLKDIIDDLESNHNLASWGEYREFSKKALSNNSNISIFANIPVLFDEFKNNELIAYKKDIAKNKEFINQLPFLGIQMDGKGEIFYTYIGLQYRDTLVNEPVLQTMFSKIQEPETINSLSENIHFMEDEKTEKMNKKTSDPFEIPTIAILNLSKGIHTELYENNNVKLEVEVNAGMKHGDFKMFYENGREKLIGKFKNDSKTGTWRLYDESGNLVEKRKFN